MSRFKVAISTLSVLLFGNLAWNVRSTQILDRDHLQAQRADAEIKNVRTLARVWPRGEANIQVSALCHGLLFYGLGPTDLPAFPSGQSMLKALTDDAIGIRVLGASPFVRTRNGVRYTLATDPLATTHVGESHRDQCLATFAALDLPLSQSINVGSQHYSISNLLAESLANFNFDQREPAWTCMAYAKYLPPQKEWRTRFGERFSFSQVIEQLINCDWSKQSCGGTHMLGAIIAIDAADHRYPILEPTARKHLDIFLTTIFQQVVSRQHADGSWSANWRDATTEVAGEERPFNEKTTFEESFLITGHLFEILVSAKSQKRLPDEVYLRASAWLEKSIDSKTIQPGNAWLCPYTHATRSVRLTQGAFQNR